jgi:hypothetical protein
MAFSSSVWGGSMSMRRRPLAGMARRRRTHRGKGFFGDLWSGVKNVGSTILPVVGPALAKAALSRFGMARRRRRTVGHGMTHHRKRSSIASHLMSLVRASHGKAKSHMGCRRRKSHHGRAHSLLNMIRSAHSRTFGRRRRRVHHRGGSMIAGARRRRVHRGRGPFGSILGSVLGHVLPF